MGAKCVNVSREGPGREKGEGEEWEGGGRGRYRVKGREKRKTGVNSVHAIVHVATGILNTTYQLDMCKLQIFIQNVHSLSLWVGS